MKPFVMPQPIPFADIYLAFRNPRHKPVQTEDEAIAALCAGEQVLELARDIVELDSLNPMEQLGVVREGGHYVALEGNRRICALKLLADPARAPAEIAQAIKRLSKGWTPPEKLLAIVFAKQSEAQEWIRRFHAGPDNGRGRRPWNSEQKGRVFGDAKTQLTQAVLDHAERTGMLDAAARKGKLTTAERFLSNPVFRTALGLEGTADGLRRNRPQADFEILLRTFVSEWVENEVVTSRMNKPHIEAYAAALPARVGIGEVRTKPVPLGDKDPVKREQPKRDEPPRKRAPNTDLVAKDSDLEQALRHLGKDKLIRLYGSLTSLSLEAHTPLLAVGLWSLVESLTACMGRADKTAFGDFLTADRVNKLLGVSKENRAIRTVLGHVADYGNNTKHHSTAAMFNGPQLRNDVATLTPLLIACAKAACAAPDNPLADARAP